MNQAAEMLLGRTEVVAINVALNRERGIAGILCRCSASTRRH